MRRLPRTIPDGHPRGYIFEPAPVTGIVQLGVRDDEPMTQGTPRVVDTPRSESTDSDEVTRMPRSVKRRTEEHSPSYTPGAGSSSQAQAASANNTEEITPNVKSNNVDTTNKKSGEDRIMTALQRFAADIGIEGISTNITRDELMDLVQAKFDKIDAEQSRRAARDAMETDTQVPAKKNSAGNSADNTTKSVTGKRSAPAPTLVSVPRPEPLALRVPASMPIDDARRVPLPESPKVPGNPENSSSAGPSAMPMARVRSLRDMLALPADTGRPVKQAGPSAKKSEASKKTSKMPSTAMDTSKN